MTLYTPGIVCISRQKYVKKQRAENMQKMKPALKKTLMAVACLSAVP
ncbi:molecular chaperone, partial [Escherichia coli]